jgi:probable phosphoglycerate mutase
MIIYLIRHGRQNSSACNVNVELAPEGETQARLLGKRMEKYPVDVLYSSDLIRAKQTARIAFEGRGDLVDRMQIRPGLAEVDFGELTGVDDEQVKEFYGEYYQEQLDRFAEGRVQTGNALEEVNEFVGDFFVPTEEIWYPGGESGAGVMARVMPVVREWIEQEYGSVAVVTHGGVIRILLTALFGGDFAKRLMFGKSLENCSITQIHFDEEKNGFYLDRFNDYAHLEQDPALLRSCFK